MKFEEELKRENQEYQKYREAWRRGEITEEEYKEQTKRDKLEELMQEWEEKTNEARESVKHLYDTKKHKNKRGHENRSGTPTRWIEQQPKRALWH